MVTGREELRGAEKEGGKGQGAVLSFNVARELGTGGGDRWRQKLRGSWGCGGFPFRVCTKRVQQCKKN